MIDREARWQNALRLAHAMFYQMQQGTEFIAPNGWFVRDITFEHDRIMLHFSGGTVKPFFLKGNKYYGEDTSIEDFNAELLKWKVMHRITNVNALLNSPTSDKEHELRGLKVGKRFAASRLNLKEAVLLCQVVRRRRHLLEAEVVNGGRRITFDMRTGISTDAVNEVCWSKPIPDLPPEAGVPYYEVQLDYINEELNK